MIPATLVLGALFLLCLPLNQIQLSYVGIQHPAIALSLLLMATLSCFGLWEIARQQSITFSTLSGWLTLSGFFCALPAFYHHASNSNAIWHVASIVIGLFIFITLQQFRFNAMYRQVLLWLPLGAGWLLAYPFLAPAILNGIIPEANLWQQQLSFGHIDENTAAIVILTAIALSAYLLARCQSLRIPSKALQTICLLTPFIGVCALMAMKHAWPIGILIVVCLLSQPFLFRYTKRAQQGLWLSAILLGFFIATFVGWLPEGGFFADYFSAEQLQQVNQALQLLNKVAFSGTGLGQLEREQLLFGYQIGQPLMLAPTPPSWLIAFFAEGGIASWFGISLLVVLITRRIAAAPAGSRLMLVAMLLPLAIAITATSFISLNPVLGLILLVLLFWIDTLSARYHQTSIGFSKVLTVAGIGGFCIAASLVLSSVYLGQRALRAFELSATKLAQYQLHPWWHDFYRDQLEMRVLLANSKQQNNAEQLNHLRNKIKALADSPAPEAYQSAILLAKNTGHLDIATQLYFEAKRLFPNSKINLATQTRH